MKRGMQH